MSVAEIVALIVGLGGFVGAVVALYNSVSQAQLNKVRQEADERQEAIDNKNVEHDRDISFLRAEVGRLDKSLVDARAENDRLYAVQIEMRKQLNARDLEVIQLRSELALEKKRTTELEKQVGDLTKERDGYLALLKASKT